MESRIGSLFIISGLILLTLGAIAGVLISFNYILPDFFRDIIPFNQLRPMHTTSVVSWIVLTAIGGVYYYVNEELKLYSSKLALAHFVIFAFTFIIILISFLTGKMGGREYLEFPPILILPILVGWSLFGYNYFKSIVGKISNWPVYYWMWGTGIVFMVFHLAESNFWWFSHFRNDYIRDVTVQWKSYGSFVGSWNMLVYGTAIYVMAKIKRDVNPGRGKLAFFFYFLGLTNLMFGWAHHTYILPTMPWVRYVAYAVSMTEWIIFIRMIHVWARTTEKASMDQFRLAYLFLKA
ncbi:cbb3-type cytochrome c oxidase subunit I, partial [bacterium]